jgi:hypothetical protein
MDILQSPRFQRVLFESASYQMLREVYRADPNLGPNSVTLLREYFRSDRGALCLPTNR